MGKVAYRYFLDGNGPYESEKFDTEEEADATAEERRHVIDHTIAFDDQGNASSSDREVINLDASSTDTTAKAKASA